MVQVRMESLKKLPAKQNTDDMLQRVIEKDDSNSTCTSDSDDTKRLNLSCRHVIQRLLNTRNFIMLSAAMVILSFALVLIQVIILFGVLSDVPGSHFVATIIFYLNWCIVFMMIIEVLARIFVMRLNFFRSSIEIFDALIIGVVIAVHVLLLYLEDIQSPLYLCCLIILLRSWRLTRLYSGELNTVKKHSERRVVREQRIREALEQELCKYRDYCSAQEFEIQALQTLLRKNGVNYRKVERPVMGQKIDVVVEVNEICEKSALVHVSSEKCALVHDTSEKSALVHDTSEKCAVVDEKSEKYVLMDDLTEKCALMHDSSDDNTAETST